MTSLRSKQALALTKRARPVARPKRGFMSQLNTYVRTLKEGDCKPGPFDTMTDLAGQYHTTAVLGHSEKANTLLKQLGPKTTENK